MVCVGLFEGNVSMNDDSPEKMKLYNAEDMAAIYLEGFLDGYQAAREEILIQSTEPGPECQ